MPTKEVFLILIIFISCVACSSAGGQESISTTQLITVELDIYSGRPNPTWTLTRQEGIELTKRLQKLPMLQAVPSVDNLGYRGFLLHNPNNAPGVGSELRVYKGIIITNQGSTRAYLDIHEIEHWLREQAHAHGQADALKAAGL